MKLFSSLSVAVLPTISFTGGLLTGQNSIRKASGTEGTSTWVVALQIDRFFHQKTLDKLFAEYREKVQHQRETGQIVSDIDEMLNESVFIPVLESNGYITKLDQYVWEQVCQTIRSWIDQGIRPLPISVNVTKTDVLAMDVAEFFSGMLKKYRIPPKYLDIDIAKSAYLETHGALGDTIAQRHRTGCGCSAGRRRHLAAGVPVRAAETPPQGPKRCRPKHRRAGKQTAVREGDKA